MRVSQLILEDEEGVVAAMSEALERRRLKRQQAKLWVSLPAQRETKDQRLSNKAGRATYGARMACCRCFGDGNERIGKLN